MSSKKKLYQLILAAMFLSLALILPLLTGQIPQIGNALCPMHFPVLLCGYFCGPLYGMIIGVIAPLLRFAIFGMPPIMPNGLAMCFELATYGSVAGILYRFFSKKKLTVYLSLICAMLAGRVVWGIASAFFYGVGQSSFGWAAFISGAFISAIPGIIAQIAFIPILVFMLQKYDLKKNDNT